MILGYPLILHPHSTQCSLFPNLSWLKNFWGFSDLKSNMYLLQQQKQKRVKKKKESESAEKFKEVMLDLNPTSGHDHRQHVGWGWEVPSSQSLKHNQVFKG